jgi:Tol biopolymer transport system component
LTLTAGTRLGPYEILAPLGAGGMGEVYRARDTQLQRDVAIKSITEALSREPEYLERFEREARVLASLNHPNIAAIYGLEERDGTRFLVLELVEGRGLDEILDAGPLPVAEALGLARQIADALAAAHARGVVHRDLKPANVRVTPAGQAKVLDFGLARDISGDEPGSSLSVTAAAGPTGAGTILGTPAYMSPEQARGMPVDRRSDLWSFGCLLFEMLSGRRAFHARTVSECLASILHDEPDWEALPRETGAPVRRLLRRCLLKDADERISDASDARDEIERAAMPARKVSRPRRAARTASSTPKLTQLTLSETLETSPEFSPDGATIAFTADLEGVRKIFLRDLSGGGTVPLTSGRHDDIQPGFAPDGKAVVFVRSREAGVRLEPGDVFGEYIGGDVWAIDVATGAETRIVEDAYNPAFSPDGARLAVDAPWVGPRRIWITDANGHNPQQASTDVSEAVTHLRPRWSPDGRRIVFQNVERTKFGIRVVDLERKSLTWVTNDLFQDVHPVWSPSGRHIYFSSYRSGGLNLWRIAVSAGGKPRGAPQQLTTGAGQDVEAAVSPDGRSIVFAILRQNADLWTLPVDPATGRFTGPPSSLIATTREDSRGAWSPDGRSVAFNSDRGGDMNLWIHALSGGSARRVTEGPGGDFQPNWSPDGRTLAFFSSRSGNAQIWNADVASGETRQLTHAPSLDINPAYSPDGRSIAFQSDRSGRLEVWGMAADGSEPRQLTNVGVGGHFLRWTHDGGAVIFRCVGEGRPRLLRVPAQGGPPEELPEMAGGSHISFSPDGSRIMDVVAHKTLWVSPLRGGAPEKVFEFEDPDVRIDYPVWSPDGRSVLFDRFVPQGGDIWLMEGVG